MNREDQPADAYNPRTGGPAKRTGERFYRLLGIGVVALIGLASLYYFLRVPPHDGQAGDGSPRNAEAANNAPALSARADQVPALFTGWNKPDVALVLSAQQHGYLQPCGCTHPQYGGLARRFNFLQALKDKGWPLVAVDLGDIAESPERRKGYGDQPYIKYATSMKSLKAMDYLAVGFGRNEIAMLLADVIGEYTLNDPSPRVLGTNLATREKKGDPFFGTIAPNEVSAKAGQPKVGVLQLVGPSVEQDASKMQDPTVKFHQNTAQILDQALAELHGRKAELIVILYQGMPNEAAACADYCLKRRKNDPKYPQVHVVLCLCETDEPPSLPILVGDTMVIRVGHKGRYVGVVGAYPTQRGDRTWELKYQLVSISPEFETPKDKTPNPIADLMEAYAKEIKDRKLLEKVKQKKHPLQVLFQKLQPDYRGSAACRGCHPEAYQIWKDSGHAHAYETLENAVRPKNRQYDPECVACHTVGFGYETGFVTETKTPKLLGVGCESCHGPCGAHIDDPSNLVVRKEINPYRHDPKETPGVRQGRMSKIDQSCQTCHDIDNDAHWTLKKWDKIVHHTPPKNPAPKPAVKKDAK